MRAILLSAACLALIACDDAASDAHDASSDTDAQSLPADATEAHDASADTSLSDSSALDASPKDGEVVVDAAAGDASVLGESRCATAGLKLCDDFESTTIDTNVWQVINGATLDKSSAARGQQSLKLHTTDNGMAGLLHRASFPFANERFWGRMLIKLAALPTSPTWAHWTVVGALETGNMYTLPEHRIGGQYSDKKQNYWGVGTDHGATGDWTNLDQTTPVKTGEWQCIEWLIDASKDESKFFRDGVEVSALATTTTTKHLGNASVPYQIPNIRQLWVGWVLYQGGSLPGSYDVWIDSVALDGERIGCTK